MGKAVKDILVTASTTAGSGTMPRYFSFVVPHSSDVENPLPAARPPRISDAAQDLLVSAREISSAAQFALSVMSSNTTRRSSRRCKCLTTVSIIIIII